MNKSLRAPVRRERAGYYLILTLLSFAASVSITRLFLYLTGYPQLGSGELHIAHVLWGGLLLFVAALLPLMYANRWILSTSAILAGVGVGLFIDEVGKFITSTNDYFYPAAAPIIYATFLLTLLLYTRLRRAPAQDTRAELYQILDELEEALDADLDAQERAVLLSHLERIIQADENPAFTHLAQELRDFLTSEALSLAPVRPTFWQRWRDRLAAFEARHLGRARLRATLAGGAIALGLWQIAFPLRFGLGLNSPAYLEQSLFALIEGQILRGRTSLGLFTARLGLDACIGLILILAAVLLLAGRERRGVDWCVLGLLLALTVSNLVVFYIEQFSTIFNAIAQFLLLLGVIHYRKKYLSEAAPQEGGAAGD